MKKLILIFAMLSFVVMATAQGRGNVGTVDADTLLAVETINFDLGTFTGTYESLAVVALCTDLGGTPDGTLALHGSLDGTSYVFISGAAGGNILTTSPKASYTGTDFNQRTITAGLVASWTVIGTPYKYYRVAAIGTANDSTLVTVKYMYK